MNEKYDLNHIGRFNLTKTEEDFFHELITIDNTNLLAPDTEIEAE